MCFFCWGIIYLWKQCPLKGNNVKLLLRWLFPLLCLEFGLIWLQSATLVLRCRLIVYRKLIDWKELPWLNKKKIVFSIFWSDISEMLKNSDLARYVLLWSSCIAYILTHFSGWPFGYTLIRIDFPGKLSQKSVYNCKLIWLFRVDLMSPSLRHVWLWILVGVIHWVHVYGSGVTVTTSFSTCHLLTTWTLHVCGWLTISESIPLSFYNILRSSKGWVQKSRNWFKEWLVLWNEHTLFGPLSDASGHTTSFCFEQIQFWLWFEFL